MVAVDPAVQKHLAKHGEIARRGEQSGVPGDSSHGERVFVVHGALDELLAKCRVIFRGRDAAQQLFGGLNMVLVMSRGAKICSCAS